MAVSYGQFGTPGYAQSTIPTPIVQQYPGAKNYQDALRGFGLLAYGPYSKGYGDLAASQATDPAAAAWQAGTGGGGGAFAQPGVASNALGNLFSSQMGGEVSRQAANQQGVFNALQGIEGVGKGLATSIDEQQRAAIQLEAAKNAQQAQTAQGIMGLVNAFTSPTGMGANIIGPGGLDLTQGQSGISPLGAITKGIGGLFSGTAGGAGILGGSGLGAIGGSSIADLGSMGLDTTDIASIFESMASAAPELAAFAA